MQLEGQVAIITGAGTGIGEATAKLFAAEGASVVVAGRRRQVLDAVADGIVSAGGRALVVTADVTIEADVERLVEVTLREFGKIDVLVNNAGTNVRAGLPDVSTADWREIVDSSATGAFFCSRAAARHMIPRQSGKIINVASRAGRRASPRRTAYTAAKFAMVGLGEAMAIDLKEHGISVSNVLPGPILTPLRRRSEPNEDPNLLIGPEAVAEAILFLATRPAAVIIPEISIYPRAFISG
jgi:NAD(P)-dependent dehydrogenase (short-subunit alcohol dehydrogenase family)